MTRKRKTCASLIDDLTPQSSLTTVQHYQWKATDKGVEKVATNDTVDTIFNELNKQLSNFLLHTFVKRKQVTSFRSLKETCDDKSIVSQVDFSENATIAA